jgi:hypothetical protein
MIRSLFLIAAVLIGCVSVAQSPRVGTVDRSLDNTSTPLILPPYEGGGVDQFINLASRIAGTGRPVHISYTCNSACAIIASLPSACLTKTGRVGLHPPTRFLIVGDQTFVMGPEYQALDGYVTTQISRAIKKMPFSWDNPQAIQLTITYQTAPQYGLRRCQ